MLTLDAAFRRTARLTLLFLTAHAAMLPLLCCCHYASAIYHSYAVIRLPISLLVVIIMFFIIHMPHTQVAAAARRLALAAFVDTRCC